MARRYTGRDTETKPSGGNIQDHETGRAGKRESNITPVISCAFLSGLSLALLTQLSAGVRCPGTAMGLDTYRWFKYDILQSPFCVKHGQVHVREADRIIRDLRFDVLTRLC